VNPLPDSGENQWFYVNTVTGDLFEKTNGQWFLVYNFNTGAGTGITNNESDGSGESIVRPVIGNTGHFKSVLGAPDEVDIVDLTTEIQIAMNAGYKPVTMRNINSGYYLQKSIGGGTFDPNGLIPLDGEEDLWPRGSLWIGTSTIWILQTPATKSWTPYDASSGVSEIINIGGGVNVFKQTVDGVAELRSLTSDEPVIIETDTPIDGSLNFSISDTYKPVTLSNVQNVKIGYENVSAPLGTDDVTKGYVEGSLYIETEPAGQNKIWICRSPTPAGSALWQEYASSGSAVKESAMFYNIPRTVTNIVDTNFNNLPIPSAAVDYSGAAVWSAPFSGTTVVFRRGVTNASGKRYLVNVKIIVEDFAGATSDLHLYTFRALQNPSAVVQSGSVIQIGLSASAGSNRGGTGSTSFIVTSNTAGQDEWYYQIRGSIGGSGSPPPNIAIEDMTVTFTEI
jgi:hypothetical protein